MGILRSRYLGVQVIFGAVEDCVASGVSGDLCIDNDIWLDG